MVFLHAHGAAQQTPATSASGDAAIHELQDQVRQLQSMLEEMRTENAQSRAEMHQLRQDLQATRALLEQPANVRSSEGTPQLAQESQESSPATAENKPRIEER